MQTHRIQIKCGMWWRWYRSIFGLRGPIPALPVLSETRVKRNIHDAGRQRYGRARPMTREAHHLFLHERTGAISLT